MTDVKETRISIAIVCLPLWDRMGVQRLAYPAQKGIAAANSRIMILPFK